MQQRLFDLGHMVSGQDQVPQLTGTITIQAASEETITIQAVS